MSNQINETELESSNEIITQLKTADDLAKLLEKNEGLVLIKLGATWCGPCKKIDPTIMKWYGHLQHEKITRVILDIDENIDLYGFYKKKRVVNGVPTLLAYYEENKHYIPDDMTSGSGESETNAFFNRCVEYIKDNHC